MAGSDLLETLRIGLAQDGAFNLARRGFAAAIAAIEARR